MSEKTPLKFNSVTVAAAANTIFGDPGFATVEAQRSTALVNMNVHKVDLTSAGAGVATITFNTGNGYNSPQTQNAGTVAQYYMNGVKAIKVAIATADTNVILESYLE